MRVFHELIRRAGVTHNNDAIFKNDYGIKIIIKEGEGPVLCQNVYLTMSQFFLIESTLKLTQAQKKEIIENITKGNIFIGMIVLDFAPNKIIESGDEKHMHIMTSYTTPNSINFVSVSNLTSANDGETKLLSNTQGITEDIEEKDKKQYMRAFKQVVDIPNTSFKTYDKGTEYITNTNYEGENIKEKVIKNIQEALNIEKPMREIQVFNKEILQALAVILIDNRINNLDDLFSKLKKT